MKLISDEYTKQLIELHSISKSFGSKANEKEYIIGLINNYDIKSYLDYGCGKGAMVNEITNAFPNIDVVGYDPGIIKFNSIPKQAEFVSAIDVLEHIEPEYIDNILSHIYSLFTKICYLEISCAPAGRKLPDGRNAHLIQEDSIWWKNKLLKYCNDDNIIDYVVNVDINNKDYRVNVLLKK